MGQSLHGFSCGVRGCGHHVSRKEALACSRRIQELGLLEKAEDKATEMEAVAGALLKEKETLQKELASCTDTNKALEVKVVDLTASLETARADKKGLLDALAEAQGKLNPPVKVEDAAVVAPPAKVETPPDVVSVNPSPVPVEAPVVEVKA